MSQEVLLERAKKILERTPKGTTQYAIAKERLEAVEDTLDTKKKK